MPAARRLLKVATAAWLSVWIVSAAAAAPSLDLSRYRGRVVYLDFWASWCAPCKQSFAWLKAMQRKYGSRGLVIIAVNEDQRRQDARRFLQEAAVRFNIIYDPEGKLAEQYHLTGLPSSFLIDARGHVYRRHQGFNDDSPAKYESEIHMLLDKRDAPGSQASSHQSTRTPRF